MNRRTINFIAWPIRILLALGFLMAGIGKVTANPMVLEMFGNWGYPEWFSMLIGILEVGGAILILVPKLSVYATVGLFVIMIGALITHVIHDPIANILRPLIFMILLTGNILLSLKLLQNPVKSI